MEFALLLTLALLAPAPAVETEPPMTADESAEMAEHNFAGPVSEWRKRRQPIIDKRLDIRKQRVENRWELFHAFANLTGMPVDTAKVVCIGAGGIVALLCGTAVLLGVLRLFRK